MTAKEKQRETPGHLAAREAGRPTQMEDFRGPLAAKTKREEDPRILDI